MFYLVQDRYINTSLYPKCPIVYFLQSTKAQKSNKIAEHFVTLNPTNFSRLVGIRLRYSL